MFPTNLKYTKDHEWVRLADDGTCTIGITHFAQGELGDIVFVELPAVGDAFSADDVFGTIEAVKTVSELFMPLGGTVVAINEDLDANPETVNSDAFGEGWMIKVQPDNAGDLASLMSADDYKTMIGA